MAEFLSQYSIQRWLEMCPQGYLDDTVYGHDEGEVEPELLMLDEDQREAAIRSTIGLVVGERAALAASSGLVNAAPVLLEKVDAGPIRSAIRLHLRHVRRRQTPIGTAPTSPRRRPKRWRRCWPTRCSASSRADWVASASSTRPPRRRCDGGGRCG